MIRSLSLQKINLDYSPAMERWYYEKHSAQVSRRFAPWLTRHESYMPVYSPVEASEYGLYNWRFVNCYWQDIPDGLDGELAFTPPPHQLYCANAYTPAQPTEIFKGQNEKPEDHSVLRWIQLIKYPDTVDKKIADDWYVNIFAPQACRQKHMYRFFSFRVLDLNIHLPGHWSQEDLRNITSNSVGGWDRFTEMWYDSYMDWKDDVLIHPPTYTKPEWAVKETFPFLQKETQFVSSFILEKPTDNYRMFDRVYI